MEQYQTLANSNRETRRLVAALERRGLWNETEAAEFLELAVSTLQRWRWAGKGPRFRKLGRAVRYASEDLADFLEAARRSSTSDASSASAP
jgi:hypothetical protein